MIREMLDQRNSLSMAMINLKCSKAIVKNKETQICKENRPRRRGLGVAQLEKLRLIEKQVEQEEATRALYYGGYPSLNSFCPVEPKDRSVFSLSSYLGKLEKEKEDECMGLGTRNLTCPRCLKGRQSNFARDEEVNFKENTYSSVTTQNTKSLNVEPDFSRCNGTSLDLSLSSSFYHTKNTTEIREETEGSHSDDEDAKINLLSSSSSEAVKTAFCFSPSLDLTLGLSI